MTFVLVGLTDNFNVDDFIATKSDAFDAFGVARSGFDLVFAEANAHAASGYQQNIVFLAY